MSIASECPCRECKDRVVGCHGTCERYKAWKVRQIDAARKANESMRDSAENIQYNRRQAYNYTPLPTGKKPRKRIQ